MGNKKNQKNQTIKKGSKLDDRRKIKENYKKPGDKPRKPGKRPGKPWKAVIKTGKPVKKRIKSAKKTEKRKNPLPGNNFDPDQIIAVLSGTLVGNNYTTAPVITTEQLHNYTYISKTNTMTIFWGSDYYDYYVFKRKGFRLVYNIIEG